VIVFLRFLAAAALLFAIVIFVYATPFFFQQNRILRTWPSVDATVVSSRIVEHPTTSGSLYATELQFSYAVNGRAVTGAFVFPHESTSRERKEKQVSRYPVGSQHRIKFNPSDATDIRINPGYNVDFFVIPVFLSGIAAIFFVLAGAFWGMAAWRKRATRGTI
jgi:hypothetical protein